MEDDLKYDMELDDIHISIHVPRVEDDVQRDVVRCKIDVFQSTSPVWRTTVLILKFRWNEKISIHVPRVEDDGGYDVYELIAK